jgi:SAM-dependent methyltransferase
VSDINLKQAPTDNAALQRRLFDEEIPKWEGTTGPDPGQATRVNLVRRFALGRPPGRMLDVGCGGGFITAPLAVKHELFGVDASPAAAEMATRNGISVRVADIENGLPYEPDSFDIVFAGETIEHLIRTDFFIHEINRVLKTGGVVILTTPNVASLTSLGMMALMDLPPYMSARYRSPHVRDFTIRTMKVALKNHGFRILEVRGGDLLLPFFGNVLPGIGYRVPRLSPQMICLAEKIAPSVLDEAREFEFALNLSP